MDKYGTIHERITQLVDTFGKGKNTTFASLIGSNEANVRGYKTSVMPKFDFLEKIARCLDINLRWLLTGEGSMLLDSKNPEESKLGCTPIATTISPAEESIIYKMYKDEKDEKERMLKEKDILLQDKESKIDHLQSELRSMAEELATLKATHPQTSPPGVVIEEIHEVLGSPRIAKHADTKPHSSTCAPSAGSVQPHQENQ